MKNKTKKSIVIAAAALSVPMVFMAGTAFTTDIHVSNYTVETGKIDKPFRIVLITDLHGFVFGKNQRDALDIIEKQHPDLIMLTGDIYVRYRPYEGSTMLLEGISKLCPCFYVDGNHEYMTDNVERIKEIVRSTGVAVLEGTCIKTAVNGSEINVCGVDDPNVGESEFARQLKALSVTDTANFSIFLSHRSELVELYKQTGFDLILTGHAHGGQWRIPFLINGLFAPGQGFFPKYAGGQYSYNNTVQIVGRGLTKYYQLPQSLKSVFSAETALRDKLDAFPRIFNPPELVVVDVEPK